MIPTPEHIAAECREAGFVLYDANLESYIADMDSIGIGWHHEISAAMLLRDPDAVRTAMRRMSPDERKRIQVLECMERTVRGQSRRERFPAYQPAGAVCSEEVVDDLLYYKDSHTAANLLYLYSIAAHCIAKERDSARRADLAERMKTIYDIVDGPVAARFRCTDHLRDMDAAYAILAAFLLTGEILEKRAAAMLPKQYRKYLKECEAAARRRSDARFRDAYPMQLPPLPGSGA